MGPDAMNDNDETATGTPARGGPKGPIKDALRPPLPKRFYTSVAIGSGDTLQILLDGRAVKTPAKKPLTLPTRAVADLVAAEWAAQQAVIDPATMPMTRFANTAIDAVTATIAAVAADLVAYAGRDLLCYRAASPRELAERQAEAWDPVLAWAQDTLGASFKTVEGVMPIEQPPATLAAVANVLKSHDPFRLTALHVLTTLTGSALLALALDRDRLDPTQAWTAAHIDEDYQIGLWGDDDEAAERRRQRQAEFTAASRFLDALRASTG